VALFTDTLHDVNGVALTIRRLLQAAPDHQTDLTVIGCSHQPTGMANGCMNFQAIGDFSIPEYQDMQLHFPPVLDVIDYVAEQGFTRIHVSTPGLQGLLGLLIARLTDLPVSGTYHTDIPQYIGCLTADQSCEEGAWNYIIWFYNQLDEVLVPSRATRDQLLRRGLSPEKPRPLPRWVDTERFSPSHRDPDVRRRLGIGEEVALLYAGRVSREKNLEILVDSFLELEASGQPVWLVVAGDGPYRAEMEQALAGHHTTFTGFLSQEELARLYASMDVFVFPSTTDTFGNVVLEAQASALPVIVTDQGGPQELLLAGRSGLVVSGNDTGALTEAMRFMIERSETRDIMSRAAREFAILGRMETSEQFSTFFGTSMERPTTNNVDRALLVGTSA
jgi:glycosyltransferase involved in cell wall biosynthesis